MFEGFEGPTKRVHREPYRIVWDLLIEGGTRIIVTRTWTRGNVSLIEVVEHHSHYTEPCHFGYRAPQRSGKQDSHGRIKGSHKMSVSWEVLMSGERVWSGESLSEMMKFVRGLK